LIHKQKARLLLIPGILIALVGVGMITFPNDMPTWSVWWRDIVENVRIYLFALIGAVSWALFSNFSRIYANEIKGSIVPLFMFFTGLVLLFLRFFFNESTIFTGRSIAELVFMGLVPMLLAYSCWDLAVRNGNLSIVASFSYLAPLFSACVSCLYLGISPSWIFWCGCVLIVCGAILSKLSICSVPVEKACYKRRQPVADYQ
jgi:drug/metabolite transporter (DMT)-like permease